MLMNNLFGDTPQLRVFGFLIDNHFFDFPMTEIARGLKLDWMLVKKDLFKDVKIAT